MLIVTLLRSKGDVGRDRAPDRDRPRAARHARRAPHRCGGGRRRAPGSPASSRSATSCGICAPTARRSSTGPVGSIMTTEVVTCRRETPVDELMTTMTERRIRHVPVVDEHGAIVGIVSIGDLVKSRISELEGERDDLVGYIGTR